MNSFAIVFGVVLFGLAVAAHAADAVVGDAGMQASVAVSMTVDPDADFHPISPLIYGINDLYETKEYPDRKPVCTLIRLGGNRTTAYHWVTNDSNAGSDWHHQNDDYLGKSGEPGEPVRKILDHTFARRIAAILTVPTIGHVSADRSPGGDVLNSGPDYLQTRFRVSVPAKNAPFTLTPDPNHPTVYQDEFVNWVKAKYPEGFTDPARQIIFSLDNEVDLWASTHRRIRGVTVPEGQKVPREVEQAARPTYQEVVQNNVAYAKAIKAVAPTAKVLGPNVWSWVGLKDLSGASDAGGRNFTEFYLQEIVAASKSAGIPLIDYFTFNHYSGAEAVVNGKKVGVTSNDSSPEVVKARVQAPRSFWDPTYAENSWYVGANGGKPLRIFPELKERIAKHDPGLEIAITEYNFGGRDHISGGIAQADFLGILGREGIALATWWSLGPKGNFVLGAFDLYRNFDGKGGQFGDISVQATTGDHDGSSIYASRDSTRPGWLAIVVINKLDQPQIARIRIAGITPFRETQAYCLSGDSPVPAAAGTIPVGDERTIEYTMPAFSVTLLQLQSQ